MDRQGGVTEWLGAKQVTGVNVDVGRARWRGRQDSPNTFRAAYKGKLRL